MSFWFILPYSVFIPPRSGIFRYHSCLFRLIPVSFCFIPESFLLVPVYSALFVSFRLIPARFGIFRYHSCSFRCHSGVIPVSFRLIPAYSGLFRYIPFRSVPFPCLVTPEKGGNLLERVPRSSAFHRITSQGDHLLVNNDRCYLRYAFKSKHVVCNTFPKAWMNR